MCMEKEKEEESVQRWKFGEQKYVQEWIGQVNKHRKREICKRQWTKYAGQLHDCYRKDNTSKPRAEWILYTVTENVNVLFVFYCLWCKGKYPKENKNPTVTWKFVHIVIILKWLGQRNEKTEAKESWLFTPNSLWNTNSHVRMSIYNINLICK